MELDASDQLKSAIRSNDLLKDSVVVLRKELAAEVSANMTLHERGALSQELETEHHVLAEKEAKASEQLQSVSRSNSALEASLTVCKDELTANEDYHEKFKQEAASELEVHVRQTQAARQDLECHKAEIERHLATERVCSDLEERLASAHQRLYDSEAASEHDSQSEVQLSLSVEQASCAERQRRVEDLEQQLVTASNSMSDLHRQVSEAGLLQAQASAEVREARAELLKERERCGNERMMGDVEEVQALKQGLSEQIEANSELVCKLSASELERISVEQRLTQAEYDHGKEVAALQDAGSSRQPISGTEQNLQHSGVDPADLELLAQELMSQRQRTKAAEDVRYELVLQLDAAEQHVADVTDELEQARKKLKSQGTLLQAGALSSGKQLVANLEESLANEEEKCVEFEGSARREETECASVREALTEANHDRQKLKAENEGLERDVMDLARMLTELKSAVHTYAGRVT